MKKILIDNILKAIEKAMNEGNRYFGIRGDNVDFEIGTQLDSSYDWDYDNDCQSDSKLNGTCSTAIGYLWFDGEIEDEETIEKALNYHKENYRYKYVTIIAGTDQEYGADENEAIIKNAEVILKVEM